MNRRRGLVLPLILAHLPLAGAGLARAAAGTETAPSARAAPAADAARSEARARFDRGLALFEKKHDAPAALAELLRAYQLVPAPRTLFMMGLVYAAMSRPVDALHALDEVVRHPGDLTTAQREVARAHRDEQKQKVGFLRIESNVPASVLVDGLSGGRTPLEADLPVAAGLRVITLESPGHLASRRETLVAGEATVSVSFVLEPAAVASPRAVRVRTNLPDAEILVDGAVVGRSPLDRPLAVDRKAHVVEARRPCYAAASKALPPTTSAAGATDPAPEEVSLLLAPVDGACPRGRLALSISEPNAGVSVDGGPPAGLAGPLTLPAGRHDLLVTRAGFVPTHAAVDVPADRDVSWSVLLVPTPEGRASYAERAVSLRRWAGGLAIGGGVVALAGGILTAIEWKNVNDAQRDRDRVVATFDAGQMCDPFDPFSVTSTPDCDAALTAANQDVHRQELWRGLSIATAAVGLAAAAAGAVLWGTGPDPHRYDRAGTAAAGSDARRGSRATVWWPTFHLGGGARAVAPDATTPPSAVTAMGGVEGTF